MSNTTIRQRRTAPSGGSSSNTNNKSPRTEKQKQTSETKGNASFLCLLLQTITQSHSITWNAILLIILIRVVGSLCVITQFDPDETWQSMEVAHDLIFGVGVRTWEWWPEVGLRGCLHPMLVAIIYYIVALFGMDTRNVIVFGPRVAQAVLVGFADIATFDIAKRTFNTQTAWLALGLLHTNWFMFYCASRTYSNSLEMCIGMIALSLWLPVSLSSPLVQQPQMQHLPTTKTAAKTSLIPALACAAFAVIIRPTSVLTWISFGCWHIFCCVNNIRSRIKLLTVQVAPVALVALSLSIGLDSWFYGQFTLVQYNFAKLNVFSGISSDYGTHPWYWYMLECIPAIVGTMLPLCVLGLWRARVFPYGHVAWGQLCVVVCTVLVMSCLPHKELRFMLPILPILLNFSAYGLDGIIGSLCDAFSTTESTDARTNENSNFENKTIKQRQKRNKTKRIALQIYLAFVVVSNTIVAVYLSSYHQRAQIQVTEWLSEAPSVESVDVLTNCHAIPLYAHLHRAGVTMRFLDCSPLFARRLHTQLQHTSQEKVAFKSNFKLKFPDKTEDRRVCESSDDSNTESESERFDQDALEFVRNRYTYSDDKGGLLPTHIVIFDDKLSSDMRELLSQYSICASFARTGTSSTLKVLCLGNDKLEGPGLQKLVDE